MPDPNQWVTRYGDYLFSIALIKTSHRESAEDLVQETFLSAVKALTSFRNESSEKTWLVSILNNKIIDYYRKKSTLKEVSAYLEETDRNFSDQFFHPTTFSNAHWKEEKGPLEWSSDSITGLDREEFCRVVDYCIRKLPPKMVPVFIAKFIDEEESEQICKDFELSSSNYWVIIHRSKLLIRACLEKNWFETSKTAYE